MKPRKFLKSESRNTHAALTDYAAFCHQTYVTEEKPETLVAAMIETCVASDAGFSRARKDLCRLYGIGD